MADLLPPATTRAAISLGSLGYYLRMCPSKAVPSWEGMEGNSRAFLSRPRTARTIHALMAVVFQAGKALGDGQPIVFSGAISRSACCNGFAAIFLSTLTMGVGARDIAQG